MTYEIWFRSTAEPVAFQPERAPVPAFDNRAEAELQRGSWDSEDRAAIVVGRDEHGAIVDLPDVTFMVPKLAPDASAAPDVAAAGAGRDGGAAPEWETRSFVDVLIDRWRDENLIADDGEFKDGAYLSTDGPEAAARVARAVVIEMLSLDLK